MTKIIEIVLINIQLIVQKLIEAWVKKKNILGFKAHKIPSKFFIKYVISI